MSFMQRYNKERLRGTPFEGMSRRELKEHLDKERYGDFWLTDAVRPSPDLIPSEGYRFTEYRSKETGATTPVITAAASREKLFDLFLSLTEEVGDMVDVVLESSHEDSRGRRIKSSTDCDDIENMILRSTLYDFEEVLLHDGNAGIAVLDAEQPVELQFDEHKLFHIYGRDRRALRRFERVLHRTGVQLRQQMRVITDDAHVHNSSEDFRKRFNDLKILLSGDDTF